MGSESLECVTQLYKYLTSFTCFEEKQRTTPRSGYEQGGVY